MEQEYLIYEASCPLSELDPVTNVRLANPMVGKQDRNWIEVDAKWDTGATVCAITRRVADAIGLVPRMELPVRSFASKSGWKEPADMVLLKLVQGPYAILALSYVVDAMPDKCDMLIGMNVIASGRFSLTVDPPDIHIRLEIAPDYKQLKKV